MTDEEMKELVKEFEEQIIYHDDGKKEYDEQGRLAKEYSPSCTDGYSPDRRTITEYKYDEEDRVVYRKVSDMALSGTWNAESTTEERFAFDDEGRLRFITFRQDGEFDNSNYFVYKTLTYDEDGGVVERTEEDEVYRYVYTYKNGLLVRTERYIDSLYEEPEYVEHYSYNQEGQIVSVNAYDHEGNPVQKGIFPDYKTMNEYLSNFREETPEWIRSYKPGDKPDFKDVMSGRVGYYPGSATDGNLVSVCSKAHCVHSFIYVDYLVSKRRLENEVDSPRYGFKGYHLVGEIEWKESDLVPNGQYPLNVPLKSRMNPMRFVHGGVRPYCVTMIMERDEDRDDSWGVDRFAFTFLLADGIATYYQLFCREYKKTPWIFLLQDHGFGCNYDSFGKGGLLDAIMTKNEIRPEIVLCADHTTIWDGYEVIPDVLPVNGGMHNNVRRLYRLKTTEQTES